MRGVAAAVLGTVTVLALTLPASAQVVDPSPSPAATSQPAAGADKPVDPQFACTQTAGPSYEQPPCSLQITVREPFCDNDVPKLRYEAIPLGTPNTTVTLTWINPTGPDVVYAGLPLSGVVLWPGAVVGADGKGIDWPGWHQASDGTWVEGDEFDWVRPSVDVTFEVNPQATVHIAYPPSSPVCLTSPPGGQVLAEELPGTGANATAPLVAAGALLAMGAIFLLIRAMGRRNRTEA
jgi:LPXTG-motif cell wall-anchored protein